MYNKFFGFKEKPFKLAPNPEYLFLGKSHDKTLTRLLFATSHGKKSLSITGELGTGKTTLCRAFFGKLDESITAAYISAPEFDAVQLLKAINYAFSIDSTPDNRKDLNNIIYEFLIKKRTAGQRVLILIDEAQNMSHEALEQILLLANLETAEGKLLQIILVGQPELNDILSSDQLRPLEQRIIKNCQLVPLTFPETTDYIEHRISIAADKAGPPFDEDSCRIIYEYSGGIPKLINIGCEMALVNAFNHNSFKITGAITREAVNVLTQEKPVQPDKSDRRPNKVPLLAIFSAVLVSLVIILLYMTKEQLPETTAIDEFIDKTKVPAVSKPIDPALDKPELPKKPLVVTQSETGEKISAGRTQVPAGSEPVGPALDKPELPKKPLVVTQSETGEKISEYGDIYSVHIGTFKTASQANMLLNNLKSLGYPGFGYTSSNKKGDTVHVVVAGKYQSYDLAKEASRSLSKNGYSNFIARAKDSLKIPAGSKPIDLALGTLEVPEKPLAVNQSETGEKIAENSTFYSVHAGTFKTASQANQLLGKLKSLGFPSFEYTSLSKKESTVYVVVAGKYQSYDLAKEASRSLSKKGYSNFIARAKDSLKIPAGSAPVSHALNKPGIPEKPPAVNQSETGEKIAENGDIYSVHAGTFKTASQANQLLGKLKSLGYPGFGYTSSNKKGDTVHVVVAGKYQSYDLAKEASRNLTKLGHSNFIARAKDSLNIPAGSKPIDLALNKPGIPEKPPVVNQSETGEKIAENSTFYSVHAGTFKTATQANLQLNNLKSLGFPSFEYTSLSKKGSTVYVVVAGKYQSYDLAKEASRSLSKKGYSNFIARAKDSLKEGPEK